MAAMEMVREIAFINGRGVMDPAAFAFAVEAIRIQIHRDFLPAWQEYLPIKRPVEVVGYTDSISLAPGSFAPIEIVSSLGEDGALGDHGGFSPTDEAWGRSQPISAVMSHEALELPPDPYGDRWVRLESGVVTALEVADAVEGDSYAIQASIAGETRSVMVSNFLHPAWFGEGAGRLDQMGLCRMPGENRGYMIVQDEMGQISNVFAPNATAAYRAQVAAKLSDRRSRTFARHARPADMVGTLAELRRG